MVRMIVISSGLLAVAACSVEPAPAEAVVVAELVAAQNPFGVAEPFHTTGAIDFGNPMFLPLGTNPRSCATCHAPDMGWTLTARGAKRLFEQSDGLAPLFLPHDEGSRPDADLSTEAARRAAFGATLL